MSLRYHNLSVERDGKPVITEVTLTVAAGEVVALIGANGAGKSTLLLAALGRLAYSGSICLADDEVRDLTSRARAQRLAYVPQRSGLRSSLNVAQVVAAGRFARSGPLARLSPGDQAAVLRALNEADVSGLAQRRFDHLSCGEQQRVLLARAVASEAPLLLLDEPTAGLDPRHALELLALLRRLAGAGRGLLVALHHLDEVAQVADRVALLHDGRLLALGPPGEVLTAGPLRAAYGVEPLSGGGFAVRLMEGRT